jgi:hypothetical protein
VGFQPAQNKKIPSPLKTKKSPARSKQKNPQPAQNKKIPSPLKIKKSPTRPKIKKSPTIRQGILIIYLQN